MARPLRISFPHAVYHVTARGNERKAIFRGDGDRKRFTQILVEMVEQYKVMCYAWVLMDNHYHLLIETPQPNLSSAIRHLNGVYTQVFNRRHHRVGHLFQGRFTSILVEKESYLLELCRYVVLNPVRAGMVKHPREWRWSSYSNTAGETQVPSWLTVDWLLGQFGKQQTIAQRAYRQFVEEGMVKQESPWSNLRSQIYLGSEVFLEETQSRLEEGKDPEIPEVQKRPATPRIEALMKKVTQVYEEEVGDMVKPTRRPSEARRVGIYLARREAGLELKQIGDIFGMGYTGVSRCVSEMAKRIEEDEDLRKRVKGILMPK